MRIAIDARKLRDYGIGTYIRNLLRHLARLDDTTDYVVLCRAEDQAFAAELGENFRAVPERSRLFIREIACRWTSVANGGSLSRAPLRALPPLTPAARW